MDDLRHVLDTARPTATYDPRDPAHDAEVRATADRLLAAAPSVAALDDIEAGPDGPGTLAAHLAVKLARSKAIVGAIADPLHVSVVFAMYKEHTRILEPAAHPHGEDFVVRKIEQLRWLLDDAAPITWSLWMVDDGCPEGSGRLAQRVLHERGQGAPAHVLFLENAIRDGRPTTAPMTSAADSQKGGSVAYGLWMAAERPHARHVVAFTDADLSTHLGQIGLLIDGIVRGGMDAAIGSRREPTSVVVKQGQRNTRGKLFIALWKALIAPLHAITDTQCGFKAFTAETVRDVVDGLLEKRFAVDIELLLKTELRRRGSIAKVPIAWIDSEAASTTTDLQPYLPMLRAVAAMYRAYLPADPEADAVAAFVESMTEDEWQRLAAHVPTAIADADPATFGRRLPVPLAALQTAMHA